MVVKRTKAILQTFSETTSSHGIPHIGESKHKCMLGFWILMTIIAACLMVWQVSSLIIRFLDFKVSVGLQLKFENREFPAVTFCNMNPYQYSLVNARPAELKPVKDMLVTYQYALQRTSCMMEGNETEGKFPELCSRNATLDALMIQYKFEGIMDTVALQAKARDLLVLLMAGTNIANKPSLSIQKREFVKSCSFNMKDCSLDDFTEFFDPKLGNCFIFNKMYNPNFTREGERYISNFRTSRAGPIYGLRLILLTNTSEYLPLTERAGVMVVIHNQTEQAFPDTFGYSVEVGTATSIGVSYKEMKRLGHPYGVCTETTDSTVYVYNGTYTSEGCQRSCLQVRVNEKCECNDPNFPNNPRADGDYLQCNGSKQADIDCWNENIGSDKANLIQGCDCPLACQEGVFDVTVSAAKWPTKKMVKIADCKEGYFIGKSCLETYKDNGVMVNVYYEQLNFQSLEESPAYRFVNLASDFGGQIGLWLGLSFISVVEFGVLVGTCCAACFNCKKIVPIFEG